MVDTCRAGLGAERQVGIDAGQAGVVGADVTGPDFNPIGCPAVDAELDDYMESQPTPEMWVKERCVITQDIGQPSDFWPTASMLHQDYSEWKRNRGEYPMGRVKFGEWMGNHYRRVITSTVKRYAGLLLISSQNAFPICPDTRIDREIQEIQP